MTFIPRKLTSLGMCQERMQKRGPSHFRSKEKRLGAWGPDGRGEQLSHASLAGSHMSHRQRPERLLFLMNKKGHGEWGDVSCTSRPSPLTSCLPWEAVMPQFLITSWVLLGMRFLSCPPQKRDHQLLLFHCSIFLLWDKDHRELALLATSLLRSM